MRRDFPFNDGMSYAIKKFERGGGLVEGETFQSFPLPQNKSLKKRYTMFTLSTIQGHERMSTRELLIRLRAAVSDGARDIYIDGSGQHDIGGPLWSSDGAPLHIRVKNPGQRVGAMCLPNTSVFVEGSAPADVGWLNAGGTITVTGDAGDTAGHCAAGGTLYIGGRAGTRSGSLMKHDPQYAAPELWILKTVGAFSFEFMGGGCAVICGLRDGAALQDKESGACCHANSEAPVLGERPFVGMVGGVVYVRGALPALPNNVVTTPMSMGCEEDIEFLHNGLPRFLAAIGRSDTLESLIDWTQWTKVTPIPPAMAAAASAPRQVSAFRKEMWPAEGLFGDVLVDDGRVAPLIPVGDLRLRNVSWQQNKCIDCELCFQACPQKAINRAIPHLPETEVPEGKKPKKVKGIYSVNNAKCIGCGLCAGVCPTSAWKLLVTPPPVWE